MPKLMAQYPGIRVYGHVGSTMLGLCFGAMRPILYSPLDHRVGHIGGLGETGAPNFGRPLASAGWGQWSCRPKRSGCSSSS